MKEIKAWQPSCCKKAYLYKQSAKRHESKCFKNPLNKACLTCKYFMTDSETVYVRPHGDQNYGDADYEEYFNYCVIECKKIGNHSDDDTIPFSNNCDKWKERN